MFLETLYRIYSIFGYNIAHVDVTAKLCEEHNIRYEDVDRVEAVVNWLETQYPSPVAPTLREDIGEPIKTSTRYYAAYGVVKRGFPMLPFTDDPPEVLELMKRVTIIPAREMPLFAPRITIFTKDGKSYTEAGHRSRVHLGFQRGSPPHPRHHPWNPDPSGTIRRDDRDLP